MERFSKALKWDWKNSKSKEESRPSRIQPCWGRPEYWDLRGRSDKICCHLNSREKPPANAGVKNPRATEQQEEEQQNKIYSQWNNKLKYNKSDGGLGNEIYLLIMKMEKKAKVLSAALDHSKMQIHKLGDIGTFCHPFSPISVWCSVRCSALFVANHGRFYQFLVCTRERHVWRSCLQVPPWWRMALLSPTRFKPSQEGVIDTWPNIETENEQKQGNSEGRFQKELEYKFLNLRSQMRQLFSHCFRFCFFFFFSVFFSSFFFCPSLIFATPACRCYTKSFVASLKKRKLLDIY